MAVNFYFIFVCGSGRRGFSSRMLRLWPQESSVRVRVDWPGERLPHPCKGPNQIFRHLSVGTFLLDMASVL
jgi:hypothetical protein